MIAPATPEDLDAIVALEEAGFDAASRWSPDAWRAELKGSDRLVVVERDAGTVRAAATFSCVADTADLLRVVVRPEDRRLGLASELVRHGRRWAAEQGAERLLLEVEADNRPALWLYVKLGFEPLAERRDYYGAGRHAVVMEVKV